MRLALFLLLMGCSFHYLYAQDTYSLSGKITDSLGDALYPATIQLVAARDTLHMLSRVDGGFSFKLIRTRTVQLLVSMNGYSPFEKAITFKDTKPHIQLGTLVLRTDFKDLDPVTVTRIRPFTISGDTVSYNTAAFPVRDGSEVEDILKRLPGVEVDQDGNVIVQGKIVQTVKIDGKEFFGGDVLLAIRNIPADVVANLQMIDDYGDKARLTGIRSGHAAKVLNIVLKPDKHEGGFGQLAADGGEKGKYSTHAFGNVIRDKQQISTIEDLANINPMGNDPSYDAGVNFADQWNARWDGSFNLNNSGSSPHSSINMTQLNYFSGEQLRQNQNSLSSANNNNTGLNGRLTFKPDSYSTLRWTISGGMQQSRSEASSSFITLQVDSGFTKSTIGQSQNNSHSSSQSWNSTLYYEHLSAHSRRRFNIQVGLGYNAAFQTSNDRSTAAVLTNNVPTNSLLQDQIINNTQNWNVNLNGTFFLPLGPSSFLELGYQENSDRSFSDNQTWKPDSGNGPLLKVDSLSQKMVFSNFSQNLHTGYTGQFGKLNLSAGLDAQLGDLRGNVDTKGDVTSYSYLSLLPIADLSWSFDKNRRLNFEYGGQPGLPSLQQITPFTNLTNPQYPITGNPALRPAYTNKINLHYEQSSLQATQFSGFGVGLGYTKIQHPIIPDLVHPKDSTQVIQNTTYRNAGSVSSLHTDLHFTLPSLFDKHFRITANEALSQNQIYTITDSLQYFITTWMWGQGLHLQLLIPDRIESSIEANYSFSHTLYPKSAHISSFAKTVSLSLNSKHYFFQKWVLVYQLVQGYVSNERKLQPAPLQLTASLQHQFLRHNKGTIGITGYNLLNQSAALAQSNSPTGYTQTTSIQTGRYFLLTFQLKFSRFGK